jgi:hypothetical protein
MPNADNKGTPEKKPLRAPTPTPPKGPAPKVTAPPEAKSFAAPNPPVAAEAPKAPAPPEVQEDIGASFDDMLRQLDDKAHHALDVAKDKLSKTTESVLESIEAIQSKLKAILEGDNVDQLYLQEARKAFTQAGQYTKLADEFSDRLLSIDQPQET